MTGNFNLATRGYTQQMNAMSYVSNGTSQQELPQTGFLHAIDLIFSVALTATTQTAIYPGNPLSLIKRIRLTTNEGADIWNTSGQGCYLYNKTLRSGWDSQKAYQSQLDTGASAGYMNVTAGAGTFSTGTFLIALRLQLGWSEAALTGLLLLQNPGVRFVLSIDWGTSTDIATTCTVGTSTVTPALECFLVPKDASDYPDLGFAKTVLEDIAPITQTGVFTYQPPRGNTYTRIIQEFVHNASTIAPFAVSDITQLKVVFSQTQNIVNDLSANRLFRQRRLYGQDMPKGVYVTELSLGNGVPELPNGRDNLDTSQITDFQLQTTVASGATVEAGSYVRTVKEQLVVVQG
jgi:hypothetical protein